MAAARLDRQEMYRLARMGAEARLRALETERAQILRSFPGLKAGGASQECPGGNLSRGRSRAPARGDVRSGAQVGFCANEAGMGGATQGKRQEGLSQQADRWCEYERPHQRSACGGAHPVPPIRLQQPPTPRGSRDNRTAPARSAGAPGTRSTSRGSAASLRRRTPATTRSVRRSLRSAARPSATRRCRRARRCRRRARPAAAARRPRPCRCRRRPPTGCRTAPPHQEHRHVVVGDPRHRHAERPEAECAGEGNLAALVHRTGRLDQPIGDDAADDVAAHADQIRDGREKADRQKRHAAAGLHGREVERQPGPVERGDRAGEDPHQQQPQHLAVGQAAARGRSPAPSSRRARPASAQSRSSLLRRKDRQPRNQPQRAEQRRDHERPLPIDVKCAEGTPGSAAR